jgi:hypothetical protein
MEAWVRTTDGSDRVDLEYRYNGRVVHVRNWPARGPAIADAAAKLRHLLIGGWATHW